MDGLAAARSLKEMLTYVAAMKQGGSLSSDEWLDTCLKHQLTLEQKIASCTGSSVAQA